MNQELLVQEKQVAMILPKWAIHMLLDHLDTQRENLFEEQYMITDEKDQESFDLIDEEISLYERAIKQIDSQLNS